MFNFVKPKQETREPESIAEISYKIKNDSTVEVDVKVEDYDQYSIAQLCKILDILSDDNSYMQTIEIIKTGFTKAGESEALNQIYYHLSSQVSQKIINSIKESKLDQPCIKPSQMLK